MTTRRAKILEGHVKRGKRFVPPFVAHFNMRDISWSEQILPELVWIAALMRRYPQAEAVARCLHLTKMAKLVAPSAAMKWFGTASSFSQLGTNQWHEVRTRLELDGSLTGLVDPLSSLLRVYPACPLVGLTSGVALPAREVDIAAARGIVSELWDRTSVPATRCQAFILYSGFVLDVFKVAQGLTLSKFPAVADYPETELSRTVASAVRATLNAMIPRQAADLSSDWLNHFWSRNQTIATCVDPLARKDTT